MNQQLTIAERNYRQYLDEQAYKQVKELHDKRTELKKMREMAESIAQYNPSPVILATIEKIEVELLYLKLQLNCTY